MRPEDRRSKHCRSVTENCRLDPEVPRRQRKSPLIDDRTDPGQEVVLETGEGPAKYYATRVVEVHERREYLADSLPGDA